MTTSLNSFHAKSVLDVEGRSLSYYALESEALKAFGVERLPFSIKVLLENLLRNEDGVKVHGERHRGAGALGRRAFGPRRSGGRRGSEISFTPARVLMQDLTGVPAVVDLAAMRDAIVALGSDAKKINPLVPVELVIDHSVIVERNGTPTSYEENVEIEYQRNAERYTFLKWAQSSVRAVPCRAPGDGHLSPGQPRAPGKGRLRPRRRRVLRHRRRHRLAHDAWSTVWACSAGASVALKPKRACSASPRRCSSRPSSDCESSARRARA